MNTFPITASYTDLYQVSMGQAYFLSGKAQEPAVFDYFFRKLPFEGGYVVFAGLGSLLDVLSDFRFSKDDIAFLSTLKLHPDYLRFLADFRFKGSVFAVREGEVVFPNEPLISVHGAMIETQLVETMLLNLVNFQSLVATKAARIRAVAGGRIVSDFGLRRAQGLGGYHASRAAVIGGVQATSNVLAAMDFHLPVVGTMAHSFVQSFDDELNAFRTFAEHKPLDVVLLVDTYDTLASGVPNAITVAKEMEQKGNRLAGIRLDSGDLAYLSKQARKMLNDAGLHYVKITASNQLDEYVIKSLLDQNAAIDVFGVGTNLVTAPPDAALDGVYKLVYSSGSNRIKLSDNPSKITLPGKKELYRAISRETGAFAADVITRAGEKSITAMVHPYDPEKSFSLQSVELESLMRQVMQDGRRLDSDLPLATISKFSAQRLSLLPDEHKRFENPHIYKVGLSAALRVVRDEMRKKHKSPS
jgi:nicotinate phosphoribosyltransferase